MIEYLKNNIGLLLAIITLIGVIWKTNRSTCPNHMQSFDKVYGRVEELEKEHNLNMIAINELKIQMNMVMEILGEIKKDIKEIYNKISTIKQEKT